MRLKPGDKVSVTPADGQGEDGGCGFWMPKGIDVEWDGKNFLGCSIWASRTAYPPIVLLDRLERARNPLDATRFTNIHCMIEQLVATGEWPS